MTVPKWDSGVRLFGVTVKDTDQYPLLKPEGIFATLAKGQQFKTLDLTYTYNQKVCNHIYAALFWNSLRSNSVYTMDTILIGVKALLATA